jgi:hypothetical protein
MQVDSKPNDSFLCFFSHGVSFLFLSLLLPFYTKTLASVFCAPLYVTCGTYA